MSAPSALVNDIPFSRRRELSMLLDDINDKPWKMLAEKIGLNLTEISALEKAYQRPGGSPTDDLLTIWGASDPTTHQLVLYLKELGLERAATLFDNRGV